MLQFQSAKMQKLPFWHYSVSFIPLLNEEVCGMQGGEKNGCATTVTPSIVAWVARKLEVETVGEEEPEGELGGVGVKTEEGKTWRHWNKMAANSWPLHRASWRVAVDGLASFIIAAVESSKRWEGCSVTSSTVLRGAGGVGVGIKEATRVTSRNEMTVSTPLYLVTGAAKVSAQPIPQHTRARW